MSTPEQQSPSTPNAAVREAALLQAQHAAVRAGELAYEAEQYARHTDHRDKAAPLAAVGALWADVARAHAAIARAVPADDETAVR